MSNNLSSVHMELLLLLMAADYPFVWMHNLCCVSSIVKHLDVSNVLLL